MIMQFIGIMQIGALWTIVALMIHFGNRLPKKRKIKPKKPTTIKQAKAESPEKFRARAPSNTELYDREKFGR